MTRSLSRKITEKHFLCPLPCMLIMFIAGFQTHQIEVGPVKYGDMNYFFPLPNLWDDTMVIWAPPVVILVRNWVAIILGNSELMTNRYPWFLDKWKAKLWTLQCYYFLGFIFLYSTQSCTFLSIFKCSSVYSKSSALVVCHAHVIWLLKAGLL